MDLIVGTGAMNRRSVSAICSREAAITATNGDETITHDTTTEFERRHCKAIGKR